MKILKNRKCGIQFSHIYVSNIPQKFKIHISKCIFSTSPAVSHLTLIYFKEYSHPCRLFESPSLHLIYFMANYPVYQSS